MKFIQLMLKISQKLHPHCQINSLTLFKEIIAVYYENNMEHMNAICGEKCRIF